MTAGEMRKESEQIQQNEEDKVILQKTTLQRRTLLKALIGIPVLGGLAIEVFKKTTFDKQKRDRILEELGLGNISGSAKIKISSGKKGELIRIGIIGFGNRAVAHANGLGFMLASDVDAFKERGIFEDWLAQENLNIALTGICDVFDLHAEKGLEIARNGIRTTGATPNLPVKRYRSYQEMLADKDIDAVMIATPDHHHAEITIAAAKAGKHVYCEKSIALSESEVNEVYEAVKNSKIVYQLGHQIAQSVVFQQAREVIEKGILGKITLIETTTNRNSADGAWIRHLDKNGNPKPGDEKSIDWGQWLGSTPNVPFSLDRYYNWVKWFAYDSGVIGQLFTHEYDSVNQLLHVGIPKSVVASGGIYYWKDNREIPDSMHVVFEYPERDLTLLYSANLASSRNRGRVFMGHDASMELGGSIKITVDENSTRYKKQIEQGLMTTSEPMLTLDSNTGKVDAVSGATSKYYTARGLTTTTINGRQVDTTYLHIKEWLDCIRNGGETSANIDRAFEEGITCVMAIQSYQEKRRVEWDPVQKKII